MSIGLVDAVAGGGKTTAIVQQAIEQAVEQGKRVCIALPTKEVIEEKYEDALQQAGGRVEVHRVHGDVDGCSSVGTLLADVLTSLGRHKPAVLFTTHKTFNDCPNWIGRKNWRFYVDELFDAVEHISPRLPRNHAILTRLLELITPNDRFSEVRVSSAKKQAFALMREGTDDVDAVFERVTSRLAQPERWKVYVETENFRVVTSGVGTSRLVDQRERAAHLHFWFVQQPWFEQEGLQVTMASACFTDRLLYKLWRRNGTAFEPDHAVMSRLNSAAHNGKGLELHCMNIEHWSTWAKNGGRSSKTTNNTTAQHELEKLISNTFGAEPFIFNANSDWKSTVFSSNATQIKVVEHGKNKFQHFHNVAFMPSLLPVPDKWQFLHWLGFRESDIRDEYYHSNAYQTVFRSAARKLDRTDIVKAVVPGRAACEYIQGKAPDAVIIQHEVLAARRGRGRPVKYSDPTQARAANAERMRLKRQAAKGGIGPVPTP